MARLTINDIAEIAGVGKSTVSKARKPDCMICATGNIALDAFGEIHEMGYPVLKIFLWQALVTIWYQRY